MPKTSNKTQKPAGYIPRPPNMFMLFRSDVSRGRAAGVTQHTVSADAGELWRNATVETRQYYTDLALEKSEEHKRKYPEYQYKPGPPIHKGKAKKGKGKKVPERSVVVEEFESTGNWMMPAPYAQSSAFSESTGVDPLYLPMPDQTVQWGQELQPFVAQQHQQQVQQQQQQHFGAYYPSPLAGPSTSTGLRYASNFALPSTPCTQGGIQEYDPAYDYIGAGSSFIDRWLINTSTTYVDPYASAPSPPMNDVMLDLELFGTLDRNSRWE